MDVTQAATRWAKGEPTAAKAALASAFPHDDAWGPAGVIAEARAALPEDARISVDSGAHRILLSQMWPAPYPKAVIQSSGLCTMGCALPLALGHAIAEPARPAVAVMGDGCAEMVLGELATLRDEARMDAAGPVVMVVLVDASLALIEMKQRRDQRPNAGVDYAAATDFAGLARLFGGHGETAAGPGEVGPAFARALDAARGEAGFAVLAIRIPR
ncbi:MAG: thiamine pyrophosphate-dependent enzyme, partial [Pseudomonadota bacterium]